MSQNRFMICVTRSFVVSDINVYGYLCFKNPGRVAVHLIPVINFGVFSGTQSIFINKIIKRTADNNANLNDSIVRIEDNCDDPSNVMMSKKTIMLSITEGNLKYMILNHLFKHKILDFHKGIPTNTDNLYSVPIGNFKSTQYQDEPGKQKRNDLRSDILFRFLNIFSNRTIIGYQFSIFSYFYNNDFIDLPEVRTRYLFSKIGKIDDLPMNDNTLQSYKCNFSDDK